MTKCCFFTIMLLGMIILFSTLIMAANPCDCDSPGADPLCLGNTFCDAYQLYPGSSCNPGEFMSLCISCRNQGQTCSMTWYGGDDCCSLNCTGIVAGTGRCCPDKWTWSGGVCQPPIMNPCEGNGTSVAGNNYCTSLGTGKNKCCGTPSNGHCEACCGLTDCTNFCEYCNTGGSIGTWSCKNQTYTDIRDDCPGNYQVCDGSGGCTWIDSNPPTDCSWPTKPIMEDGKLYELVMCTDGCTADCPGATTFPPQSFCRTGSGDNPFWNVRSLGCTWCLADNVPDCLEICVLTGGAGCGSYESTPYPEGCCDPDDECNNNNCCPAGTTWNGTSCGGCHSGPPNIQYACANEHTGGIASCTCGGPCYDVVTTLPNGSVYTEPLSCEPDKRCVTYHPDPMVDPDMPAALKVCNICRASSDCCVPEGGSTANPSMCCQKPTVTYDQYLTPDNHCCRKGTYWRASDASCALANPCYSSISQLGFCLYLAPNSTLPQSGWWGDKTECNVVSSMMGCCFINAGMYGYVSPTDPFYYWHERRAITVY